MINENGVYLLFNVFVGFDCMVIFYYDEVYLNGVFILDMILISQYIFGLQFLDSFYKCIVVDINGFGYILIFDFIQFCCMIFGIEFSFDNVSSWCFVDVVYVFFDLVNLWEEIFLEVININDLVIVVSIGNDFIVIKIGDVNGDVEINQKN